MCEPKVFKCRLMTAGKSLEQLREQYSGQGLSDWDLEQIQRSNECFDGVVLLMCLWAYDNYERYHFFSWEDGVDEKMMMGVYFSEQMHPFPRYLGNREQFIEDWKTQNYFPDCPFSFEKSEVEVLAAISHKAENLPAAGGKQPISPVRTKLEEINRLKPFVRQAKEIAQRERVRQSMKSFEEERRNNDVSTKSY